MMSAGLSPQPPHTARTLPSIMKYVRSILTFYKSFAALSLFITACCLCILYTWGIGTLTELIWFKILTLIAIFYHFRSHKKAEFYYYKNIGISRSVLWFNAFTVDVGLFIFLISFVIKFR